MNRILLVDDHPVVREGLAAVLEGQADFQVVGSAGSAEEGIVLAQAAQPDVLLLDLELPGMDGVTAIKEFARVSPASRVIIFTAYDTDERVLAALRAGAKGYLLKGASSGEIGRAIREVFAGGSYMETRIAHRLVTSIGNAERVTEPSPREREVLRLVAEGWTNKQIAPALGISERTVKFHMTSLFNKLGAESRAQAVAIAGRKGFLQPKEN
jgi:DNA-binding NarL/FixJ family response regulator